MKLLILALSALAACSNFTQPTVQVHCEIDLDSSRIVADTTTLYYSKHCNAQP